MNETNVSIKFQNHVTGQNKVDAYVESLKKVRSLLDSIETGKMKQIEDSSKNIKNISNESQKAAKNINLAFDYSVIKRFASSLGNAYKTLVKFTTKSSDYLEAFNLFQVAFDGNYRSAERFINKMTEMYGLDESWGIRTVGIFKQLSNAMNLSTEAGTKLSTLLTQMSVDISSLYNIDIERAVSTLQSSLAGQTKPIRGATGGDITQTTLQQTLSELGINRYIADLSYAEKRLIIIISLTRQLSEATNDFGRTIESPANQMRILNEQWNRLTRAVGNVFLPILSKVLPYLNAILMVLTEIINIIARLFGYRDEDFDYFKAPTQSISDFGEGIDSAAASADNLKKKLTGLRGFDKLNVITTPANTSGGSGGGGGVGGGGIDPAIMDAFNKAYDDYFKKIDKVQMKATKIRDAIMEWLGFEKLIDEETGDIYFKFKKITGGTILGALAVGGVIFTGVSTVYRILKKIGLLKFTDVKLLSKVFGKGGAVSGMSTGFGKLASALGLTSGSLAAILGIVVAIAAAFVAAYKRSEKLRENVKEFEDTIKDIASTKLKDLKENLIFIKDNILLPLYNNILKPLGNMLITILTPVFRMIIKYLDFFYKNIITPLMPLLNTLKDNILNNIAKEIKIIGVVIELVSKGVDYLYKNVVEPLIDYVQEKLDKVGTWIQEKITDEVTKVQEGLKNLKEKYLDPIIKVLELVFLLVLGRIIDKIEIAYLKIKTLYTFFKTYYDQNIKPIINEVKRIIGDIKKSYNSNVKSILDEIKRKIDEFKKAWDKVKEAWKLPNLKIPSLPRIKLDIVYETNVSKTKKAIADALGLDGYPRLKFVTYAQGGMPQQGQIFIANEKGAELVGNIGGQSFVANQNQMMDLLDKKIGKAQSGGTQIFNIYLDENNKIGSYTLNQLKGMAKTNGEPIVIR